MKSESIRFGYQHNQIAHAATNSLSHVRCLILMIFDPARPKMLSISAPLFRGIIPETNAQRQAGLAGSPDKRYNIGHQPRCRGTHDRDTPTF